MSRWAWPPAASVRGLCPIWQTGCGQLAAPRVGSNLSPGQGFRRKCLRPAESSPGLSPPARRSEKGYPATEGSACQNSLRVWVFRQERVQ